MGNQTNQPSPAKFWMWFNPVGRQAGGWAFLVSRITAIGLTFYLFLHLAILSLLAKGPAGYDSFLKLVRNPIFTAGELLVVAGAFLHGLNGIRIVLTTFGVGVTRQKQLFYGLMTFGIIVIIVFGIRMFAM